MTDIDKELMRRFKAETIGQLIAAGMILAGILLFGKKANTQTKMGAPSDNKEIVSAKQSYADSVQIANAVKFDTLQSRTK